MSKGWISVLAWGLFAVAGAALVIVADRQGWLSRSKPEQVAGKCPHGLASDQCPFCDESLVEEKGFCAGHGVPEAYCTKCAPSVTVAFKAIGDWCNEHGLPESQCTLCNPGALDKYATTVEDSGALPPPAVQLLPAEELPRTRRPPSVTCTTQTLRVQFQSPDIAAAAGLRDVRVERRRVPQTLTCNVEIVYDANRHVKVSSQATGVIAEVRADLGQTVAAGDVLAVVGSAELSSAKANYLRLGNEVDAARALAEQTAAWFDRVNRMEVRLAANACVERSSVLSLARKTLEREEALIARNATSERELLEARAVVVQAENALDAARRKLLLFGIPAEAIAALRPQQIGELEGRGTMSEQPLLEARRALVSMATQLGAARDRLRVFDLSEEDLERIRTEGDSSGRLPLHAPLAGVVVARTAALGEVVASGQALLEVADTSRMWAMLDVYENDVRRVRNGLPVVVDIPGLAGERHGGRTTWIGSHVDARTRTLKVRAEIANPQGLLRDGMFGKAIVTVCTEDAALVIPKEARQWEGCCNVVFVKHSDVLFEPRKVRLGHETNRFFVVEEGLTEGERIVTTGSFLLKTEILKGSIGAGCCEIEPGRE